MRALKESRFFSTEKVAVNRVDISPLDFTSKILFDEWKLGETEKELTVMRVTLKGENSDGQIVEIIYNMHDEYCSETNSSSMARTMGYTATAAANIFLDGLFTDKGVFSSELVGKNETCFNYFFNYLEERNIVYKKSSRLV
ncbi:MAG: hypothetical protein JKY69_03100 [Flavobacteriaceae bacterium]|nr:hypothetical protein [Flavobacteriaceae bacterium]